MPEYPEHDKIMRREPEHAAICEFLEWLDSEGWSVHRYDYGRGRVVCVDAKEEDLIAEYFDVDLEEFENEKQRMLQRLRDDSTDSGSSEGTDDRPADSAAG